MPQKRFNNNHYVLCVVLASTTLLLSGCEMEENLLIETVAQEKKQGTENTEFSMSAPSMDTTPYSSNGIEMGIMNTANHRFVLEDQYDSNDWLGSWNIGVDDRIVGFGDFDSDGKDEYIVKCPWGIGLIGRDSSGRIKAEAALRSGTWVDGWNFQNTQSIVGVGDFNGDARDEFIIQSSWGIGIIGLSSRGLYLQDSRAKNTLIGNFPLESGTKIVGVGDFNGNALDDIVVRNPNGSLGVLSIDRADGRLTSLWALPSNYYGGDLALGTSSKIVAIADLNGNGRTELVYKNSRVILILGHHPNGFRIIARHSFGETLSPMSRSSVGWRLSSADQVVAVADMNSDGQKDLIVKSNLGLGILSLGSNNRLQTRVSYRNGHRFAGGWRLGQHDIVTAAGNFNGLGGEDLLLQSGWGLALLSLSTPYRLTSPTLAYANGTGRQLLDHKWVSIYSKGDLNGDGKDEVVIMTRPPLL